jgi:chaperonin GroES
MPVLHASAPGPGLQVDVCASVPTQRGLACTIAVRNGGDHDQHQTPHGTDAALGVPTGCPGMKIRPIHDRVIVKRLEQDSTSTGGIVIPGTAAEKPMQGKVVAVGNGKVLESGRVRPCDVKVGDKILFGKHSGSEAKLDGEQLVVMREEDVMAIIESK